MSGKRLSTALCTVAFLALIALPARALGQQQQQQSSQPQQPQAASPAKETDRRQSDNAAAGAAKNESKAGETKAAENSSAQPGEADKAKVADQSVDPTKNPGRHEQMSEDEAAILPYYNNFLASYRLGPEDIISVSVFGLERYSKSGITIPPDGRIAYPLIPEGIIVVGKTTQQVQTEIVKQLEEYVIDPKVTVTLDQARSARYAVIGDVKMPGVRPMLRRLTVGEALAEAGGVLETGSKKKVMVLRRQLDGNLAQIPVNISAVEKGRAPDNIYLAPGDQIIVPGNTLKTVRTIASFASIATFARIFTNILW